MILATETCITKISQKVYDEYQNKIKSLVNKLLNVQKIRGSLSDVTKGSFPTRDDINNEEKW